MKRGCLSAPRIYKHPTDVHATSEAGSCSSKRHLDRLPVNVPINRKPLNKSARVFLAGEIRSLKQATLGRRIGTVAVGKTVCAAVMEVTGVAYALVCALDNRSVCRMCTRDNGYGRHVLHNGADTKSASTTKLRMDFRFLSYRHHTLLVQGSVSV